MSFADRFIKLFGTASWKEMGMSGSGLCSGGGLHQWISYTVYMNNYLLEI